MNWLKTLMILALLAQPLCAVSCDLAMAAGSDTQAQAADTAHDCCAGDEDAPPADTGNAGHCADCTVAATLALALVSPSFAPPGVELPPVLGPGGTAAHPPKPRPPNA